MKKTVRILFITIIVCIVLVLGINIFVTASVKDSISKQQDNADCILVLGAGVNGENPSPMLKDRLDAAIELYKSGAADKILMSGDHGRKGYDEVNVMKRYAAQNGVPDSDVFMDHAGFSTYESIYRAREIFGVKSAIVVTQKYHLFRALYIARSLGVEATGVSANPRSYAGAVYREAREVLARNKDFVKCIFKPKPTYLGDVIPISGNGNLTND